MGKVGMHCVTLNPGLPPSQYSEDLKFKFRCFDEFTWVMVYSVQVRRLKTEDPLEALVLRGSKRKLRDEDEENSTDPNIVFRLAHTSENQQPDNHFVFQSTATHSGSEIPRYSLNGSKRLKKNKCKTELYSQSDVDVDEEKIPAELTSMIADYINPQKAATNPQENEVDKEVEDYVYDVYFSDKAGPVSDMRVGYIEIDEAEEKLLFGDTDSETEFLEHGDDEDSNAEDYYKNEYPDEEGDSIYTDDELSNVLNELHLEPESWSEEDANDRDAVYERYGWK